MLLLVCHAGLLHTRTSADGLADHDRLTPNSNLPTSSRTSFTHLRPRPQLLPSFAALCSFAPSPLLLSLFPFFWHCPLIVYQVTPLELSGRQFPELVSPLPMAEEEVPQKESWFLINMEPQMKKHACVASGQYTLERFTEFCDDLMEFLKTIMAKTSDPSGWKRLLRKDWGAAPQSAQDEFGMAKVVLRATRWQATGEGDDWNDRKSDGRSVAPTHRCSIGLVADVHLNAVTRV